jgi:hypothetical protein
MGETPQKDQLRGAFPNQASELHVQLGDLFGEDLVATSHRTKREPRVASRTSSGSFLRRKREATATSSCVGNKIA